MLKIEFETENDDFYRDKVPGSVRILQEIIQRLKKDELEGSLRDINGNRIGSYSLDSEN